MISIRPSINGVLGLLLLASTPFLFGANNPVKVESLSAASERVPFQAPIDEEAVPAPTMQGIETQYQLQLLQQDVQEMRGLVEEMSYQLKRMQATQEDRYLELDSRIQALQSRVSGGSRTTQVEPNLDDDLPEASGQAGQVPAGQSERVLYETALELIRNRQFDLAITQLKAVITQYPDGDFIANAYYWLGEVYAAKPDPDYEQARQALAQVITFFPRNPKVPDAAFKLGKVYHMMGDCARAREVLTQVIKDHQGKSAAKLAENYLRDKVGNCGQ